MTTATLNHISEKQFQDTVTGMLDAFGWNWIHFRPARTSNGYKTAVSGSAAKGWPDLMCFRGTDSLALECKKQNGRVSQEQHDWIKRLNLAGIEARIVRPSDTDWIEQRLRQTPQQMLIETTTNSTEASWTKETTR